MAVRALGHQYLIGRSLRHYLIVEKVGEGGMGEVYRGRDEHLARDVAIKVFHPGTLVEEKARKRFRKEAQTLSQLNHPNIATIYDFDRDQGTDFLAMEFIAGQNISDKLVSGSLSETETLRLGVQLAEGLVAAHAVGVIHCDIKPGNLRITRDGRLKIVDFGLARIKGRSTGNSVTRSAEELSVAGTLPYMAPEQLRALPLDDRIDIYAAGAVMYEMATGRQAFGGGTAATTFDAILNGTPASIQQVNAALPAGLDRVIAKALAKDRRARYQTAAEFRDDLKRVKQDSDSGRTPRAGQSAATGRAPASVAVLYFENLSGAKDDEYFRDGMTEDVITELSKIKHLHVFPRLEMLAYRDKPVSPAQAGQELNAAYVLSGSLRRAGNRLRITAQLVETRSRHSVWVERYDREMADVFEVQDEIARKIAQALRITLSPQEEAHIAQKPTEDLQAYDYFLRGRNYLRLENFDFALQMFEQAVARDSNFALAYAGIANACGLIYELREKQPHWVDRGLAACERAMALDPGRAEVLAARARMYYAQQRYDDAAAYARLAIERKPDCEGAYNVLGRAYFASDRFEEAALVVEQALEANGDDYNTYIPYRVSLERLGRKAEALRVRERQTRALERQLELVPDDVRARILLAVGYAHVGRNDDAVKQLQRAVELRPNDGNTLYNATCVYGVLGRPEDALEMLRRAFKAGYANYDWVKRDPDLALLRDNPEFQELVGRK